MKILFKEYTFLNRKIPFVVILWFALAFIAVVLEVQRYTINNYLIFKQVFWHVLDKVNLYSQYPAEYEDSNHYGPLFSLLIAPFAVLPVWLGCILWGLVNAWSLLYAIQRLKISKQNQLIIIAITAIEMMTSVHNVQFNPMLASWIILTYVWVDEEKDFWATLLIAAGFLIKLYGIGGLLFFVFSKHKLRFIGSFIFWMAVLFCVPMIYSSPAYIITCYKQWYQSLVEKNQLNVEGFSYAGYQDFSVMGMIRRITYSPGFENIYGMAPGALLIVAPLLRFKQYVSENFRLTYLAIVLISVVIFSSSSESATFVIAVSGVGIWYILHFKQYPKWSNTLLILVFILTILSATDLTPQYLKDHFVRRYSLKALPPFIVWLWLIADVIFKNFTRTDTIKQTA